MKQYTILHTTILLTVMVGWTMMSHAQRYETNHGKVYYGNELLTQADAQSFVDLGYGYAKDHHNVYMNGRVLENVDPLTFRLKARRGTWLRGKDEEDQTPHGGYFKNKGNVYFEGEKVVGANGLYFKDLGDGYAKDNSYGFYCGKKVVGANGYYFENLGNGYAKDNTNMYYKGKKI